MPVTLDSKNENSASLSFEDINTELSTQLDNISFDVASRFPKAGSTVAGPQARSREGKRKVVVLGTGFTSMSLIQNIDLDLYDVVVVSPRPYFLFTPLLDSWILGKVGIRSLIEPLNKIGKSVELMGAECTYIDNAANAILCRPINGNADVRLSFDYLFIGAGSVINTYGFPGVHEHAMFLKSLPEAREIKRRIMDQFILASAPLLTEAEKKIMLSFVVVGNGLEAAQFACHLSDLSSSLVKKEYPALSGLTNVALVLPSDQTVPNTDHRLSDHAFGLCSRKKVRWIANTRIADVLKDSLILEDGRRISFGVLIWAAEHAPTALVRNLDYPKDKYGRLLTDRYLRVIGARGVFAAGDCAIIEAEHLPSGAIVAQREGKYVARYLNETARGKTIGEFSRHDLGALASIGISTIHDSGKPFGRNRLSLLGIWKSALFSVLAPARNNIFQF